MGDDYQVLLDAITHLGSTDVVLIDDEPAEGCGCGWADIEPDLRGLGDPRSKLIVHTIRFALGLPSLRWLVFEQVPAAEFMWEDITAELYAAGWASADVLTCDAATYGVASIRRRSYLIARRHRPSPIAGAPETSLQTTSMARALGWPADERVNTRGSRTVGGGNEFSADQPSWCLTSKARSWRRVSDGLRLTEAEAGILVGFPHTYAWHGSRSSCFQQAADAVSPVMAAVVLGIALGIEWEPAIRAHLATLYGGRQPAPPSRSGRPKQLEMFATSLHAPAGQRRRQT